MAINGILFVLKTGIQWEDLPPEMGCCGMTCWRQLRDLQAAGVWDALHQLLLNALNEAGEIDWSRAVIDSASVRAVGGGANRPQPDGSRQAWQQTPCDYRANGLPLAAQVTAANVNDVTYMLPLVDAIPPVRGQVGHPRRPDRLQGDRAYDSEPHREELRRRGIKPVLARRNKSSA